MDTQVLLSWAGPGRQGLGSGAPLRVAQWPPCSSFAHLLIKEKLAQMEPRAGHLAPGEPGAQASRREHDADLEEALASRKRNK